MNYALYFQCHLCPSFAQRMQDLPFLLKRLLRDMMDPQRSLPFVIKARVFLAVKLSLLCYFTVRAHDGMFVVSDGYAYS